MTSLTILIKILWEIPLENGSKPHQTGVKKGRSNAIALLSALLNMEKHVERKSGKKERKERAERKNKV
jgi:hypothetical protein